MYWYKLHTRSKSVTRLSHHIRVSPHSTALRWIRRLFIWAIWLEIPSSLQIRVKLKKSLITSPQALYTRWLVWTPYFTGHVGLQLVKNTSKTWKIAESIGRSSSHFDFSMFWMGLVGLVGLQPNRKPTRNISRLLIASDEDETAGLLSYGNGSGKHHTCWLWNEYVVWLTTIEALLQAIS